MVAMAVQRPLHDYLLLNKLDIRLYEYFLSKNEKEKSKEFLIQIIELENSNPSIKAEAQKMINRYFGG